MRDMIVVQLRRDGFKASIETGFGGDVIITTATASQLHFSAMMVLAPYCLAGMLVIAE